MSIEFFNNAAEYEYAGCQCFLYSRSSKVEIQNTSPIYQKIVIFTSRGFIMANETNYGIDNPEGFQAVATALDSSKFDSRFEDSVCDCLVITSKKDGQSWVLEFNPKTPDDQASSAPWELFDEISGLLEASFAKPEEVVQYLGTQINESHTSEDGNMDNSDFKKFYQEFEAAVKKELTADLWEKSCAKGDPQGFAKELFDSDIGFTPASAADEYVEMVRTMEKGGEFNEEKKPWSITYKDLDGKECKESFKTEQEAWSRYSEVNARCHGMMSDILEVTEPVNEEGGSAASLGAPCTVPLKKTESLDKDAIDRFTVDDPNYVDHGLLGDIVVKVAKKEGTRDFKVIALIPGDKGATEKVLKTAQLINAVEFYRDLFDMPLEDAVFTIEEA